MADASMNMPAMDMNMDMNMPAMDMPAMDLNMPTLPEVNMPDYAPVS